MKITVSWESKCRIPKVGEIWRHMGDDTVYMRVAESRIPGVNSGLFCSVQLSTGEIVEFERESTDFEILDGELLLRPV